MQFEVAIQTELHPVLKHKFLKYQVKYLKFSKKLLQFQWLFEEEKHSELLYIKQWGALKVVFFLIAFKFFRPFFKMLLL